MAVAMQAREGAQAAVVPAGPQPVVVVAGVSLLVVPPGTPAGLVVVGAVLLVVVGVGLLEVAG